MPSRQEIDSELNINNIIEYYLDMFTLIVSHFLSGSVGHVGDVSNFVYLTFHLVLCEIFLVPGIDPLGFLLSIYLNNSFLRGNYHIEKTECEFW